jgi:hypothetical protein
MFELSCPFPKSHILFQLRVIDGEIQNQLQIDTASGSVNEGSVKNWLVLAVRNALFESAPNGPEGCAVGEDVEAVSEPVIPVPSTNRAPGLNV